MAPVARVVQLGEARVAGRRVGRDRRGGGAARIARDDRELALPARGERPAAHVLDGGERRGLARQPGEEPLDRVGRALDLEHHPALVVADPAGEPLVVREPEHVGPEADALHRALDARAGPRDHGASTSSRSTWNALACASWMRGMCWERVMIT